MVGRGRALRVVVLCTFLFASNGLELLTHARHGKLWQSLERNAPLVESKRFLQPLDHFNASNRQRFAQRYFQVDTFSHHSLDPVLLYIGGQGPLSQPPKGFVLQLARYLGAKVVALEHRFYGESLPEDAFSTKNLGYLTVQQTMEDLARFVRHMQRSNEWIAIGGSGQVLAARFR